jgi:hypothetical protein
LPKADNEFCLPFLKNFPENPNSNSQHPARSAAASVAPKKQQDFDTINPI